MTKEDADLLKNIMWKMLLGFVAGVVLAHYWWEGTKGG